MKAYNRRSFHQDGAPKVLTVNEYFDGNVKSIALQTETLPATVGVMEAGDYEFGTSKKEVMTLVSGSMDVLLPGETEWKTFAQGESFEVAANVKFGVKTQGQVAYFCTYE
tara:strand:+ start:4692 stop:5021 length:330 start_codon:yes stop_codon:yes gene_type:complete